MAGISIKLDRRFERQARGAFEKYQFDVGVLNDRVHRDARSKKDGLKSFQGGPIRQQKPTGTMTIGQVSEELRINTGINFYTAPFKSTRSRDIKAFSKTFFDFTAGRVPRGKVESALQAIVRNPILRGDYGRNSKSTEKRKGFNRFMIDTAQLFKAIVAKVRVKNV